MSELTRRAALRFGGVAFAGGLAGCTALSSRSSDPPRVVEFRATNYDTRPHTVHVLLDGGEPAYWTSKRLPAAEDGDAGSAVFEDFPTDPGNAVLHVRADDKPKSEWTRFDLGRSEFSCLGIHIKIGFHDEPTGDVSINVLWGEICEEETTTNR